MTLSEHLALLLLLVLAQNSVSSSTVKRENNEGVESVGNFSFVLEKSLFGGSEEKYLEKEILEELNHLNSRKQREIFDDLEKQHEKFNVSHKSLAFSETENLSPLSVAELKNIRQTIKASNSSLPAVRNKRTLNFLLLAVARAMGYTLTPSNPDAEWIPRQQPPSAQPCSAPSPPPPPPCNPNPPSTPPPCSMPPTAPPCPGSSALMQSPTIPPNQVDANTISYPYRPARTIPLFNFAPLPAGMRVPYPSLLQPPAQQRSPCTPQQPSPPSCGTTPPSPCGTTPPPPCGTTPPPQPCNTTPKNPPPCRPTSAPSASPCGATPPPSPCNMTPATPSPPCKPTSPPPCQTPPAPSPPPCMTTPAPPPPCAPTPSPSPPPCGTPKPPPCSNPTPPPCGNPPPPPPPPPSEPPKKGSILLEYDDPVRIQIFSNDKKYLPASGSIYSGHADEHNVSPEKNKKNEDFEEMEEEHIEEEEEEDYEAPGQLKHYEEEDERSLANSEEEDESETSLSIVKKPVAQDLQKTHTRRPTTSKTKTSVSDGSSKKNEKEDSNYETAEKFQKMTKPKKKKWIRIVKKQRRKSKTDPNPQNSFQIYSSDNFPEASQVSPKYFGKRDSQFGFDSYERDVSDFSDDPSSHSSEDVTQIDLKKITVNNKEIKSPELKSYELNFNPYALEPEDQRRKKLEKAVERYVEDYVEKQLGNELIKNTGVPKTTVFEFSPKNGPKIQTITTTVAKTSHSGNNSNFRPQPKRDSYYNAPIRNAHIFNKNSYEENLKRQRNAANYGTFTIHT